MTPPKKLSTPTPATTDMGNETIRDLRKEMHEALEQDADRGLGYKSASYGWIWLYGSRILEELEELRGTTEGPA